jgi:hypothetical protein
MSQEEEQFKIRLLEKEIKDLKASHTNLKVDNEEYRQQINQLKEALKAVTKQTITTADKIPVAEQSFEMPPWDYIREYNKVHLKQ